MGQHGSLLEEELFPKGRKATMRKEIHDKISKAFEVWLRKRVRDSLIRFCPRFTLPI